MSALARRVAGLALVCAAIAGCGQERYARCAADLSGCPGDSVCDESRHLCLQPCSTEGCALDETCERNSWLCQPSGSTPPDAVCTREFECTAQHLCAQPNVVWQVTPPPEPQPVGLRGSGAARCLATCPTDARRSDALPWSPSSYGDDECPTGSICGFPREPGTRICIPACHPDDASSCPAGAVCKYNECFTEDLAASCDDGSSCPLGEICDSSTTPPTCLAPIDFDVAHPRSSI